MPGKTYKTEKNQIGERIRLLREERHLSRVELAFDLGISDRHIADIETGSRGMSMDLFYDLVKALGANANYILYGESVFDDDDEERTVLMEGIHGYLSFCDTNALHHMNDIARIYVASHTDKDKK